MNKSGLIVFFLISFVFSFSQSNIGNYVNNGSFEALNSNSVSSYYNVVKYWPSLDTNKYAYYLSTLMPPIANAPYAGGFQYPRSGKNHISASFYCSTCFMNTRGYPRNRLKEFLKANTAYCVKFYVVLSNGATLGLDAIAAYFGDSSLDTISRCTFPLTYLSPQVSNPGGNMILDTLRWIPVTGTFVASGNEKYMMFGNFKSNASTNTVGVNPSAFYNGAEYCVDDVSVIEMNLQAYAGRDTMVAPGSPVFIGREPDFATDSGCVWYKWPNMTVPIDTISGFWINPTTTSTYIVKQTLECSPEKWDTVVIYVDIVGIGKLEFLQEELKIFPVPAGNSVELQIGNKSLAEEFNKLMIYNQLGQFIREEEIRFINGSVKIDTRDLSEGVYSLRIVNTHNESVSRKLLISR